MFCRMRSSRLGRFSSALIPLVFTLLFLRPLYAQVTGARLSGTMADQSGGVVPNAANAQPNNGPAFAAPFPQCFNLRGNSGRKILTGPGLMNLLKLLPGGDV
jgi:hypothetical protein